MILSVETVSIAFGNRQVLDSVSFHVEKGETVALMGPNGAGKTTLLRCILGLVNFKGRITIGGFDAQRQGVKARRLAAYVPQAPAFYDMTAREAVHFLARLRGVPVEQGDAALARLGLDPDAERPVKVFSGGMQQRLSLAAALIGDPPLILLDEPTANLDPDVRARILALVSEFRAAGKSVLVSSHRSSEIRSLVDRVVLLRDGRVAAQGRPDDVLPQERFALKIGAHTPEAKARVSTLLTPFEAALRPSRNGTLEAVVSASHIIPAIEALRAAGIPHADIHLRPDDEGSPR